MFIVGVVGPSSSVTRILNRAKKLQSNINFVDYSYQEIKETDKIIRKYNSQVDSWLFSGEVSYLIAYDILASSEKLVYIDHTESGIYKGLLQFSYDQNIFLDQLSIDELGTAHLNNALSQLDITSKQVYIKNFDFKTSTSELIDFHRSLWERGKTKGALTCFQEVYNSLKKLGIPTYRISTTDLEIGQTLKIILEKRKTSYFKGIQTGVQLFEVENYDAILSKLKSSYHVQYLELKIKEILVKLCEKLNGTFTERGPGQYLIYSNRKAIEDEIDVLYTTIQQLALETESPVSVGIGFDETLYSAEINAIQALKESKKQSDYKVVIIQEPGGQIGTINSNEKVGYLAQMDNNDLIKVLENFKINIKSFNALFLFVRRSAIDEFTVKDISTQLYWDKRNTQRFFNKLCGAGLLHIVDERSISNKGRPSRVYKLNYSFLSSS